MVIETFNCLWKLKALEKVKDTLQLWLRHQTHFLKSIVVCAQFKGWDTLILSFTVRALKSKRPSSLCLYWIRHCDSTQWQGMKQATYVPIDVNPSIAHPANKRPVPHHLGLRPPIIFRNSSVGCFTFRKNQNSKQVWDLWGLRFFAVIREV